MNRVFAMSVVMAMSTASAHAGFTKYNQDFAGWKAASGMYSTVTFGEVPANSEVTDQYASLGLLFTSLDLDTTYPQDFFVFPQDGFGLDGNCQVGLTFSQPISAIGWHFPGNLSAKFYLGDTLVATDPFFGQAGSFTNFVGFAGDLPFDRVTLTKFPWPECGNVGIDNIYFSAIPAPCSAAPLNSSRALSPSPVYTG